VGGAFAGGNGAVMAAVARCRGLAVVYGQSKRPPARAGSVASIALIGGQWMGR